MNGQQNPAISLVIPTFNRMQLLAKALESVAAAVADTSDSIEVIVVDNASTDDTPTIVKEAASGFPCLLSYVRETEQGSSQARNRGLEEAQGFYIVYMDDDQLMDREYLKNIPVVFDETGASCIGGPVTYYNAQNFPRWLQEISLTIGQTNFGDQTRVLDDSVHKGLMGGNIAFIKSELRAAGAFNVYLGRFADDAGTGEDLELQDRMRNMGKKIVYDPRLIQYHYFRSERLKKSYWRRYFYDYGRSIYTRASLESSHQKQTRFPVPLWLVRVLLTKDFPRYFRSFLTLDSYQIFRSELQIWVRKGQMHAARGYLKEKTHSADNQGNGLDS